MNYLSKLLNRDLNDLLFELWSDHGLSYVARWVVTLMIFGVSTLFFGFALQRPWFILLIAIAFFYSFISAARYLKDLYELPELGMAIEYLAACSYLPNLRPKILITNGKMIVGEDEINLVDRIGGPGIVRVDSKNVVLFEKLYGYSNVYGEGIHDIHRNEFIRDVLTLDEQHCPLEMVEAITVDGIRVRVNQIHVRYRLRQRLRNALKNLSDNRLVSETGLLSMNDTVKGIIAGAIQRYINQHTIDQIITPEDHDGDSRQALREELTGIEVRNQMMSIGVDLVGTPQLGALEFPDTSIDKYRLGRWKETQKGEIKVLEAEGKAYELSRQDAVRSQTQVEMIRGILTALKDMQIDDTRDLDALIQFRTAQILDMWSGLYNSEAKDDPSARNLLRSRDKEDEEE